MSIIRHLLIVYLIISTIKTQNDDETTTELVVKTCKNKDKLIGPNKTELYDVTEVTVNETIILECHYCNEKDPHEPKIWYTTNYINDTPHEVELGMNTEEELNRISVSTEHSLTIHHSVIEDAGVYFCRGVENAEDSKYFNYILDFANTSIKQPEKGNMSDWKRYFDDYIHPINEKLLHSNEIDFLEFRNNLKTQLEVITDWEFDYRPCEVCGRPAGEAIQQKFGFCRIEIKNSDIKDVNISSFHNSTEKLLYFLNLPKVSCRSLLFQELFPNISKLTENLYDFILVKKCKGICNPDAEGVNRGWKFSSSKNYKYRKTMTLQEGEHLTLICPESTLENKVIWRRNGKVLTQGQPVINDDEDLDAIHIIVDAFNSLYLIHVTDEESGNYTCQVDSIRMQQIRIFVKSKSRLLTEEFLRHMKYLAFILLMSGTCYCAGVIAACVRRDKYKGYEEVSQIPPKYVIKS